MVLLLLACRSCAYQAAFVYCQHRVESGGLERTQPHQDGVPVATYVPPRSSQNTEHNLKPAVSETVWVKQEK